MEKDCQFGKFHHYSMSKILPNIDTNCLELADKPWKVKKDVTDKTGYNMDLTAFGSKV